MDDYRNQNEPWDPSIYGTGRTRPPKNHGGIIAVLLVVVIFLSGLVSVLGILNVKLFAQLKEQSKKPDDALSFVAHAAENRLETTPATAETVPASIPRAENPSNFELSPILRRTAVCPCRKSMLRISTVWSPFPVHFPPAPLPVPVSFFPQMAISSPIATW